MNTFATNRALLLAIAALVLLPLGGCDGFLNTSNPNAITSQTFYQKPADFEQSVNTLYNSLGGLVSVFNENSRDGTSVLTDGAFDTQQAYYTFSTGPQSGATEGLWSGPYFMIFRANTVLANIDRIEWSDQGQRDRIVAEARFFRGLGYFNLAHMFGRVPIVTEPAEGEEGFNPPKAESVGAVYDQAISDLQAAKQGLPPTRSTPGKVTQGTAGAYLGKTYLYRAGYLDEPDNYGRAAQEFQEIVESGVYGLVDTWQDNFTAVNENNQESLLEIQYLFNPTRGTPTQSRPFNSVPGIGFEIFQRPSPWLMDKMTEEKTVNGNLDPRYLQTVYANDALPLFGVPYDRLGSGIVCEGGQGASPLPSGETSTTEGGWWRKYLNVNMSCPPQLQGQEAENNERLMRYADVLLMHAEAEIKASGGSMSEAVESLRKVRSRANLATQSYAGPNEVMEEIKHQRVVELAYENKYYFDLIRWGELGDALRDHGTQAQVNNYDPEKHKYFPIPVSELSANSNLEQNEAWK